MHLSTEQDNQQSLPFDVCERKHRGNSRSVAANLRVAPFKETLRERVRGFIAALDYQGATVNEIKIWDEKKNRFKPANELSGRLTELRMLGLIFDSGRVRAACAVYVADRQWCNGSATEKVDHK